MPQRFTARDRSLIETHHRLLEEGTRLLGTVGLAALKTTEVAKAASVAAGTYYVHFEDKDALVREILVLGITEIRQTLELVGSVRGPTFRDTVISHINAFANFAEQKQSLARALFHPESARSTLGSDVTRFLTMATENLLRESRAVNQNGNNVDPVVASQALVGMLLHVLYWWTEDTARCSREELIATLSAFYCAAAEEN